MRSLFYCLKTIRLSLLLVSLFIGFYHSTFAQQLRSVDFAKEINADSLFSYLNVLTADSLEGRETGHVGQKRAATFIASKFIQFGLLPLCPDTFQEHPLSARSAGTRCIKIKKESFVYRRDYFSFVSIADTVYACDTLFFGGTINQATSKSTLFINRPTVLLSDEFVENRFKKRTKRGLQEQLDQVKLLHPSVVFIITKDFNNTLDSLVFLQKENDSTVAYVNTLPFPVYWVSGDVGKTIYEGLHDTSKEKDFSPYSIWAPFKAGVIHDDEEMIGENIPFLLKGFGKPDELLVITAHYDHLGINNGTIHPGADDDGSGTSAVIEMARIFSLAARNGVRPYRSILFMPVSGEEKGLLGSKYYAAHPLLPLEKTIADINIDMIGRIDPHYDSLGIKEYIYVIGSDKLSTELHLINEQANVNFSHLILDYRYNVPGEPNRFYFRSDHYNFAKNGIPSIFYFNGKHADYHQSTDTIDKIDFDVLRKRTLLIFHTAWELANRKDRIRVDRKNNMEK